MSNKKQTPKPAAPKNTSATEKPVNPADVLATGAAQAASPAMASEGPAKQPDGNEGKLPPAGEGPAASSGESSAAPAEGNALSPIAVEALVVTSEIEGFRRAGRAWSRTPTTVPIAELSEEQIVALEQESLLQVVYVAASTEKVAG